MILSLFQMFAGCQKNFLFLLTDLFGLNCGGVLSTEAELGDGDVVQDDVEVFRPLEQLSADQQGHLEGTKQFSVYCTKLRHLLVFLLFRQDTERLLKRICSRRFRQSEVACLRTVRFV